MAQATKNALASLAKLVLGAVSGGWAGIAVSAASEGVDYWKGTASPRMAGSIIQDTAEAIYRYGESVGWSRERTEFLGEAAVEWWTGHRPGNDEIVRLNFNREVILARV